MSVTNIPSNLPGGVAVNHQVPGISPRPGGVSSQITTTLLAPTLPIGTSDPAAVPQLLRQFDLSTLPGGGLQLGDVVLITWLEEYTNPQTYNVELVPFIVGASNPASVSTSDTGSRQVLRQTGTNITPAEHHANPIISCVELISAASQQQRYYNLCAYASSDLAGATDTLTVENFGNATLLVMRGLAPAGQTFLGLAGVQSISAADGSITIGGTPTNPTISADGSASSAMNYQRFSSHQNWQVPSGITAVRVRAVGAGGGGGAGGTSATASLQAGGGGGAAGTVIDQVVTVTPGDTLAITAGDPGASGGTGGGAGANTGGNGNLGTAAKVVNGLSTTLVNAPGGSPGHGSAATSTTVGGGGLYSTNGSSSTSALWPGSGGVPGATPGPADGMVIGGGGGGAASASAGGGGGTAQSSASALAYQAAGVSGASGTTSGVAGAGATMPGCGGAGGGGGNNNTGAGGNGGQGGPSQVEIWW